MFERRRASSAEVNSRLDSFSAELSPFRDAARGSAGRVAWIDEASDALLLGHAPEIAPEAFEICLFPPLLKGEGPHDLPPLVHHLLSHMNGANLFELRILGQIEGLSRQQRQPLSLIDGQLWSCEYEGFRDDETLFAVQNVTWTGQVGYFASSGGTIIGRSKGADVPPKFLDTWCNLHDWGTTVLTSPWIVKPSSGEK